MSYTFLKRNVFNLDLKRLTSEQARISKGSLFHSQGVATENARWPQVFMLKFGSSRREGVNDPLMTVMAFIDGKFLKYLQDNGDRSHSMF